MKFQMPQQQTSIETMKTIFKNLVIHSLLLVGVFFSCNEDDDSLSNDEIVLEDLSKIVEDDKFTEYIRQIYTVSQRIENPDELRTLINSNENLTEAQQTQVALMMGFTNLSGLQSYYESQTNRLLEISDRYDIENENNTDFEEIFYQTVLNVRDERLNNSSGRKSSTADDIGEFCRIELSACDDALYSSMNPNMDFTVLENFFCSELRDQPEYTNCVSDVNNLLSLELTVLTKNWCKCLGNVDCAWTDEINEACNF